jgi:two-component system, chemotaxis family, chemotaxis protein CheY
MKEKNKPELFYRCSSCGTIFQKDEGAIIQNPAKQCCNNASDEFCIPWPSSPVRKLMAILFEQDMATLEGQQFAIVCLHAILNTLMEESIFLLLRNCSRNGKYYTLEFCNSISRDIMFRLFDELNDIPLKKYLKNNAYPFFLDEYKSFMSLRDKIVHNNIKQHTLDEIELILSLRKDCLKIFLLINNGITSKSKKQKELKQIKKALIVDDEVETTEQLGHFLGKQGLEIIKAFNGKEAINKYKIHKPDIVFLDIALPDIDGIEVLSEIRKYDENATIYFLTGMGGEILREQVKELGAKGHLTKPIFVSDIISIIKGEN